MRNIENLNYKELLEEFKTLLKENNLKYTTQREVILKTLYKYDTHFSPEELHRVVRKKFPKLNIGITTIYRTLNLLEKNSMVSSISFGSQGKKFELNNKPHHDHLICISCGEIVEFEDKKIEKKQEKIAASHGYVLTGHIMQLYGHCLKCQNQNKGKN